MWIRDRRTIPRLQRLVVTVGDHNSQRIHKWPTKIFAAHLNLLREMNETEEACLLQNKPPESLEDIIAFYTSAINDATLGIEVIGLAEVSRFTPRQIAYVIQETGDSLGEYKFSWQPFDLPYSQKLNGQRLMVLHSDPTYAFEKI